jgi:hypothetical protein
VTQTALFESTRGDRAMLSSLASSTPTRTRLFDLTDPRHATPFGVTRLTAGYVVDVVRTSEAWVSLGGAIAWNGVARELEEVYGGSSRRTIQHKHVR